MFLIFYILSDYICGYFVSYTPHKISIVPYLPRPHLLLHFRKLFVYLSRRYTFQYLYYSCWRVFRWSLDKYMNMILHEFHRIYSTSSSATTRLFSFFMVLVSTSMRDCYENTASRSANSNRLSIFSYIMVSPTRDMIILSRTKNLISLV